MLLLLLSSSSSSSSSSSLLRFVFFRGFELRGFVFFRRISQGYVWICGAAAAFETIS